MEQDTLSRGAGCNAEGGGAILTACKHLGHRPFGEHMMNTKMMCAVALGCASLVAAAGAKAQTDQDKQFLTTASQANYNEIQFSKLAVDKSSNPTVKAFAQKMITDHTRLGEQMQPFAEKCNVTPASSLDSEHQQKYDQLKGMSGADFDKEYMTDMTADHKTAVDLFKSEEGSTTVPALKAAVTKGERVVSHHLEMAKRDDAKLGVSAGA